MTIPIEKQSTIPFSPFPLAEFTLIRVLREGLKALYKDLTVIDVLFPTLPLDERDQLKEFLQTHQAIEVVHNYPRRGVALPIIALSLAAEQEDASKETMGYFVDELLAEGAIADIEEAQALAMRSTYNIMVFTQERGFTIHFYNLIKAILLMNMDCLSSNGLHDIQMSGNDFRFEEDNYFPTFAYSRNLALSALHYDAVIRSDKILKNLRVNLTVNDVIVSTTLIGS